MDVIGAGRECTLVLSDALDVNAEEATDVRR